MKFKFLKAIAAGLILSASCLVNVANAGLMKSTSEGFDIVIDSQQKIEWLNISHTANYTQSEILNMTKEGGSLEEWRYATFDEMVSMISTIYPFFSGTIPSSYRNGLETVDFTDNILFHELITDEIKVFDNYFGAVIDWGQSFSVSGIYGKVAYNVDSGGLLVDEYQVFSLFDGLISEPSWEDHITFHVGTSFNDLSSPNNHFLVRNTQTVSEPSTLAIFVLGIMGLVSRRLKSKS
jgi:hypothetical protein